ncbi:MAG: macA 5 [Deltaproteobacteria bacterium]|nr:macA 5 [Deltaproteobacteria bacterium]
MRIRWEVIAVLALSGYLVWLATGARWPTWLGGEREITVSVVRVSKRATPGTLRISGLLLPAGETEVVSLLAGRVSELRYQVGQRVAAGAVLATLVAHDVAQRQIELENSLVAARKELQDKEQSLAAADKIAARTRELFKQDLIARIELEQVETAWQTTRAQADLAQAQFSQLESMLSQARKIQNLARITAPIAGVISRRWVEPGAMVEKSGTIFSIANVGALKFSGRMTGEFPGGVRPGLGAEISSTVVPSVKLEGKLTRVELRAENGEANSQFEIQIKDSAPKFRSGMTADALITLEREETILLVPRAALVENGGKHYLFKLEGGRAVRQEVKLGAAKDDEIAIDQGVEESDLVILDKVPGLKQGSRVRAPAAIDASKR